MSYGSIKYKARTRLPARTGIFTSPMNIRQMSFFRATPHSQILGLGVPVHHNTLPRGVEPRFTGYSNTLLRKYSTARPFYRNRTEENGRALFCLSLWNYLEIFPVHSVANRQPHYTMPKTQGWIRQVLPVPYITAGNIRSSHTTIKS